MMYSVWNPGHRGFDYYRDSRRRRTYSAPTARHLRSTSKHGTHPDAAAWPLPPGARPVGRGPKARGFIASRGAPVRLGALPFDLTGPNLVVLGVVAYLFYENVWKGRR